MIYPPSLGACLVESGFVNQIWVLTGLVLHAIATNQTLCLPPFTALVHDKRRTLPFEALLDPAPLVAALRPHCTVCDNTTKITRHNGWHAFKHGFAATRTRQNGTHALQPVVDRLNDHLRPSATVRDLVQRNLLAIGAPFTCVHARVERDIGHVAKVPRLRDFERAEGQLALRASSVFVASGANLTSALPRGWAQSTLFVKATRDDPQPLAPYVVQAAVDYFTCASAQGFVGYAASSFSRSIAERLLRDGKPVIFACPDAEPIVLTNVTRLRTHWTLCPTKRPLKRGSFGWT